MSRVGVAWSCPRGHVSPARQILAGNLLQLEDPGALLLVGDCGPHMFFDTINRSFSGFIDLESARGGDPLADIAGISLQEQPDVASALRS